MFCITTIKAQTTTTTSSASSKTVTVEKEGKQTSYNTVAISRSGDTYTLRGEFTPDVYLKIKTLIEKNLDRELIKSSTKTISWIKEENSKTAYSFSLTNSTIKINIDKKNVSNASFNKLSELGETISEIISGK